MPHYRKDYAGMTLKAAKKGCKGQQWSRQQWLASGTKILTIIQNNYLPVAED